MNANGSEQSHTHTTAWHAAVNAGSGRYAARFVAPADVYERVYIATDTTTRVTYSYDQYGNVTGELHHGDTATGSDDRYLKRVFGYNTADWIVGNPTEETLHQGTSASGALKAKTTWIYNAQGFPTEKRSYHTSGSFVATTFTPDAWGRVVKVTNPRGFETTTSYDPYYGDAKTVSNPLSHTVSTAYDGFRRPATITDANGGNTELRYDDYGRLTDVWFADPGDEPAGVHEVRVSGSAAPSAGAVADVVDGVDLCRFVHVCGRVRTCYPNPVESADLRAAPGGDVEVR